ncbi:MAG: sensor histidine kinase [Planctomycetota bacterium]|jgi:signal transduction histidine kinase
MEPRLENARLVNRAHWLIRLRWIATICVVVGTYCSSEILGIELQEFALYGIGILLAVYNVIVLLLLKRFTRNDHEVPCPAVKRIINFQISADLSILTVLLHFSGGIENPFVFYFMFHMIIASILLSVRESYLHTTFAVLLFGLLVLLEYLQLIPHYCLKGFVVRCLHRDGLYVLGRFFVFTTALYLVVYMASYIAVRLKRAEQAYRAANILLEKKDRIKDEYVLRVTHDIKGHLASIEGCLGVVAKRLVGPLGEQQADFIDRAHKRTKKLTHFVRTLLRLTQMRLDDKFEMDVFSLTETIYSTIASVKSKAEDKSLALNCIIGNQFSIEEMFSNLLLNAIKYTPEKGEINVSVKNGDDFVEVVVADTGIGVPAEDIPRIFDEFYRANNARRVQREGTGLGLSIVKQIVDRHDGKISVESKQDQGTTFSVTLPKGPGCGEGEDLKVRQ